MTDENTRTDQWSVWMAERAIVLQVLRDDHDERWTRAELEEQVSDLAPQVARDGIARLEAERVVVTEGEHVLASRCARHMDALELVSV
jgi:hypothetical protein